MECAVTHQQLYPEIQFVHARQKKSFWVQVRTIFQGEALKYSKGRPCILFQKTEILLAMWAFDVIHTLKIYHFLQVLNTLQ